MDPMLKIMLFTILTTCFAIFVVLPISELNRLRSTIDNLPEGLWDLIKNHYNDYNLLITIKGDKDYAKNKLLNANTKIKYFESIKNYCEEKIKNALAEMAED